MIDLAGQISQLGYNILSASTNPKDFNSCTKTGVYSCGGASANNAPTASPYGTLIVFESQLSGDYTIQLFFGRSGSVHYRHGTGIWTQL